MQKSQKNKAGFIVTAELLFIVTVLVIGIAVGYPLLRNSVIAEIADTAQAIGSIDQSYFISGTEVGDPAVVGSGSGSAFVDDPDTTQGVSDDVADPYELNMVIGTTWAETNPSSSENP